MIDGPRPIVPGTLGVFGGTFDPIHLAHLAVAEEAAEVLGLERVLFIPAGRPPHKPGLEISSAGDRLAMVELAIAGNPRVAIDRLELDRPGPSYTVDTLEALGAEGIGSIVLNQSMGGINPWAVEAAARVAPESSGCRPRIPSTSFAAEPSGKACGSWQLAQVASVRALGKRG